jgi:hypothetical protein
MLGAFAGWGTVAARLLVGRQQIDGGLRAAWGIALTLVLGGVANLTGTFSPALVWIYLTVGVGVLAVSVRQWASGPRLLSMFRAALAGRAQVALGVLVGALTALRYAGSVYMVPDHLVWSPWDDLPGYLVFAEKLVQTGSVGADPFNARQVTAGLNGTALLQGMVLAVLPLERLNIIEPGIPIVVVVWLLLGSGRSIGLPPTLRLAGALFYLLFVETRVNTSSVQMSLAMVLGLGLTLDYLEQHGVRPVRAAALVALGGAGALTLKGTNLPMVGAMLVLSYGALILDSRTRRRGLGEGLLALAGLATFLLPWMIAQHRSGGTFFFPIFGHGVHVMSHQTWAALPQTWADLPASQGGQSLGAAGIRALGQNWIWQLLVLLVAYLLTRPRLVGTRAALAATAIGAAAVAVMIDVAAAGGIRRLVYPYVCVGLLCAAAGLLAPVPPGDRRRPWRVALVTATLATGLVAVHGSESGTTAWYRRMASNVRHGLRGADPGLPASSPELQAMQAAVPPGALLLVRLHRPYLLDYRRNPIWVLDLPGSASPPPGLPFREGGESLARYLGAQGVRYVAFTYRTGVFFSPDKRAPEILDFPVPWFRPYNEFAFAVTADLAELGQTRQRLFDDGSVFVIDLASPSPAPRPGVALPEDRRREKGRDHHDADHRVQGAIRGAVATDAIEGETSAERAPEEHGLERIGDQHQQQHSRDGAVPGEPGEQAVRQAGHDESCLERPGLSEPHGVGGDGAAAVRVVVSRLLGQMPGREDEAEVEPEQDAGQVDRVPEAVSQEEVQGAAGRVEDG